MGGSEQSNSDLIPEGLVTMAARAEASAELETDEFAVCIESDPVASVRSVIRSALLDEALAFGLKQRLADMRERLERLEGSASKKRSWAATIMQRFDLAAIKEPDFTASLRPAPPRVIVMAEHEITDEFFKLQPPKLDKKSVLDALKSGIQVPGATLSNQESILSVRTK